MQIENGLVKMYEIDDKYQCPRYCDIDHIHKIHYKDKKCDKCIHFSIERHGNYQKYKLSVKK